jgi:hypothetical protein
VALFLMGLPKQDIGPLRTGPSTSLDVVSGQDEPRDDSLLRVPWAASELILDNEIGTWAVMNPREGMK